MRRTSVLVLVGLAVAAGHAGSISTRASGAALARNHLYAADCAGNIYRVDDGTREARVIGNSGVGGVTGLVVHPVSGVLYGITGDTCEGSPGAGIGRGRLVTIDTATGNATAVGEAAAGIEPGDAFSDLAFAHDGALYGVVSCCSDRSLVAIDVSTGTGTQAGMQLRSPGGGLAAWGQALYHSRGDDGMLWTLDGTGQVTAETLLTDATPVTALAVSCDGRLFASRQGTSGGALETIDAATGSSSVVVAAVAFDAIAFDCTSDDADGDGIGDAVDVCPTIADADQRDSDADGQGDACDADDDNDEVADASDTCPLVSDAAQQDADGDGIGDACDPDADNDGVLNAADNCPAAPNASQSDGDGDGSGDPCDPDGDSALQADAFITMNGNPVGTAVSPSVMRTGTLGFAGGSWSVNDSAVAMKVGPGHFGLPSPVRVGTTVYPVAYQTQSLAYDTYYSFNTMQANLPDNNFTAVSTAGFITFGIPDRGDSGALSDLVRINLGSGALAVFQLFNGHAPGDRYAVNIETDVSGTVHSPFIEVMPGGSYWFSFKADFGAGRAYLNLYDATTFSLAGAVVASTKKGKDIAFIRYGNGQGARSSDHTHFNYFQNIVIDWTRAAFPLGPRPLPPDTSPPSSPGGLVASAVSYSRIDLVWTAATDDVGVAGYRVYRNGSEVAVTSSTPSYSDTGLAASTSYSYSVAAFDYAGNLSAESAPTLGTTPDVPFDFAIAHGGSRSVVRGQQVTNIITSVRTAGVAAPVTFSATGLPSGATASFEPSSCTPDCGTIMTIATAPTTTPQTKTVTVAAKAGATTRTTKFTLTILAGADVTPPSVSLSAPAHGTLLSGGTTTVRATAGDNVGVAGVQFLLDGVPLNAEDTSAPYSTSWNVASASNGPHILSARARDGAGNATTSSPVTVHVDRQPPTGSVSINGGATATRSRSVTLTLAAIDDAGSVTHMRFSNSSTGFSTAEPFAPTKAWTLSSGSGTKTVRAQFRDAAGNWSTSVQDSIVLDTSAPTISSVSVTGLTSSGATITWTTSERATSQVEYGLTGTYGELTPIGTTFVTSHTVVLTGLSPLTTYYYRVVSRDEAGNVKLGSGKTFTTR